MVRVFGHIPIATAINFICRISKLLNKKMAPFPYLSFLQFNSILRQNFTAASRSRGLYSCTLCTATSVRINMVEQAAGSDY